VHRRRAVAVVGQSVFLSVKVHEACVLRIRSRGPQPTRDGDGKGSADRGPGPALNALLEAAEARKRRCVSLAVGRARDRVRGSGP